MITFIFSAIIIVRAGHKQQILHSQHRSNQTARGVQLSFFFSPAWHKKSGLTIKLQKGMRQHWVMPNGSDFCHKTTLLRQALMKYLNKMNAAFCNFNDACGMCNTITVMPGRQAFFARAPTEERSSVSHLHRALFERFIGAN